MSASAHGEHPSPEELDVLVDGTVDGTSGDAPPADGLAAHVASCPRCAQTVADLSQVRTLLRAEAGRVPPPPADLDDRIGAALARAAREENGARGGAAAPTVVPMSVAPMRRRGGVPRWAAAAAGIVVLGGAALSAGQLLGGGEGPVAGVAQESAGGEQESAAAGAAEDAAGTPVLATGTDYRPEELDEQVRDLVALGPGTGGAGPGGAAEAEAEPEAGGDARLAEPEGLEACLQALGTDAAAAAVVDLATWQGRDVAVIVLEEGERRTVWVVERGCRPEADGLVHYQVLTG